MEELNAIQGYYGVINYCSVAEKFHTNNNSEIVFYMELRRFPAECSQTILHLLHANIWDAETFKIRFANVKWASKVMEQPILDTGIQWETG